MDYKLAWKCLETWIDSGINLEYDPEDKMEEVAIKLRKEILKQVKQKMTGIQFLIEEFNIKDIE